MKLRRRVFSTPERIKACVEEASPTLLWHVAASAIAALPDTIDSVRTLARDNGLPRLSSDTESRAHANLAARAREARRRHLRHQSHRSDLPASSPSSPSQRPDSPLQLSTQAHHALYATCAAHSIGRAAALGSPNALTTLALLLHLAWTHMPRTGPSSALNPSITLSGPYTFPFCDVSNAKLAEYYCARMLRRPIRSLRSHATWPRPASLRFMLAAMLEFAEPTEPRVIVRSHESRQMPLIQAAEREHK